MVRTAIQWAAMHQPGEAERLRLQRPDLPHEDARIIRASDIAILRVLHETARRLLHDAAVARHTLTAPVLVTFGTKIASKMVPHQRLATALRPRSAIVTTITERWGAMHPRIGTARCHIIQKNSP